MKRLGAKIGDDTPVPTFRVPPVFLSEWCHSLFLTKSRFLSSVLPRTPIVSVSFVLCVKTIKFKFFIFTYF